MNARRRALWVVVRVSPHRLLEPRTGAKVLEVLQRLGWSMVHRRHRNVPRELRPA